MDHSYFKFPKADWQRRYEALRASFLERIPAGAVALRFGYKKAYVYLLRHLFKTDKLDFAEPLPEGKAARWRVSREIREKICTARRANLSAGEIAQILSEEDVEISVRTVERVLAEEGFPKLPRRARLKMGITVKGAAVPKRAEALSLSSLDGQDFESDCAGALLFAPFLAQMDFSGTVRDAGLPGTSAIPALSHVLSLLALKLLGDERYAHVGEHGFGRGLGLFAGLNVLPKCTSMSTYSFGLDAVHIERLQKAFIRRASNLGLYGGAIVNLDFHTVPHFGEESALESHWAGARNKTMKGALTLIAQDAESKLMLYTDADIRRFEADDQVLDFLSFWRKVRRGINPTLIFDSRFTTYPKLSKLNVANVKFVTLRRRGEKMIDAVGDLDGWQRIHIPHDKRKFPNPLVHVSTISLQGYDGHLRQVIVRGNGHEKPTFLISNDFDTEVELLVGNYARRWRVENVIAEAVKFFHLNAISSPILLKVHFDLALTMIADTLYTMLARRLRGFEDCDAPKLYRHFVRGKASVSVRGREVTVIFPRRAHNPVLRAVEWDNLPSRLLTPDSAKLKFRFM
ncbi:MAG: transposase [Elusimicrobia bacterium]|nr:transposase [Elusimicrobiota bacterium]